MKKYKYDGNTIYVMPHKLFTQPGVENTKFEIRLEAEWFGKGDNLCFANPMVKIQVTRVPTRFNRILFKLFGWLGYRIKYKAKIIKYE